MWQPPTTTTWWSSPSPFHSFSPSQRHLAVPQQMSNDHFDAAYWQPSLKSIQRARERTKSQRIPDPLWTVNPPLEIRTGIGTQNGIKLTCTLHFLCAYLLLHVLSVGSILSTFKHRVDLTASNKEESMSEYFCSMPGNSSCMWDSKVADVPVGSVVHSGRRGSDGSILTEG